MPIQIRVVCDKAVPSPADGPWLQRAGDLIDSYNK